MAFTWIQRVEDTVEAPGSAAEMRELMSDLPRFNAATGFDKFLSATDEPGVYTTRVALFKIRFRLSASEATGAVAHAQPVNWLLRPLIAETTYTAEHLTDHTMLLRVQARIHRPIWHPVAWLPTFAALQGRIGLRRVARALQERDATPSDMSRLRVLGAMVVQFLFGAVGGALLLFAGISMFGTSWSGGWIAVAVVAGVLGTIFRRSRFVGINAIGTCVVLVVVAGIALHVLDAAPRNLAFVAFALATMIGWSSACAAIAHSASSRRWSLCALAAGLAVLTAWNVSFVRTNSLLEALSPAVVERAAFEHRRSSNQLLEVSSCQSTYRAEATDLREGGCRKPLEI